MKINKKISLSSKICSIILFAFSIIIFCLLLALLVNMSNIKLYEQLLFYGFCPSFVISSLLLIYVIVTMILINKYNWKNPMFYLLMFTSLFTIIVNIVCLTKIKPMEKLNLTAEMWLLLVANGFGVLFTGWNLLEKVNLIRPISRFIHSLNEEINDDESNKNDEKPIEELKIDNFSSGIDSTKKESL